MGRPKKRSKKSARPGEFFRAPGDRKADCAGPAGEYERDKPSQEELATRISHAPCPCFAAFSNGRADCRPPRGTPPAHVLALSVECGLCRFPAGRLVFSCSPLARLCRLPAISLQIPLSCFPPGPCRPPAALCTSSADPANPVQARCKYLQSPCRSPAHACRSLAVPQQALAGFVQSPCRFPSGPPCSCLAVSLQFPCRRSARR